jgi:hypothetical protein
VKAILAFLLAFCAATAWAGDPPQRAITSAQAKALVMAALTDQQRQLPKVEAEREDAPSSSSRFLFFTVTWAGTPNESVIVGNYAVDPYTGDVFSSTRECYEEKNKRLEALQAQVRAKLHLSQSEYQRLRTKGPLCGRVNGVG